MVCGCGAPTRDGVCQRGHRLEEWSPASRAAAALARAKDRLTEPTPVARDKQGNVMPVPLKVGPALGQVMDTFGMKSPGMDERAERNLSIEGIKQSLRPRVRRIGVGEHQTIPLPEGEIKIKHIARHGPLSAFQVEGGGSHVDPDLRRGDRTLIGKGVTAQEVAERVHHAQNAERTHNSELVGQIAKVKAGDSMSVHSVQTSTMKPLAARITPQEDGTFKVEHPNGTSVKSTPIEAAMSAKSEIRKAGGTFLPQNEMDPVSNCVAGVPVKAQRIGKNRKTMDEMGEFVANQLDVNSGDSAKEFMAQQMGAAGSALGTPWLNSEGIKSLTDKSAGPEVHQAALAHVANSLAQHVAAHVAVVGPHVAAHAGAIHAITQVMQARVDLAHADLNEAVGMGDGARIITARARLQVLLKRLEESVAQLDEIRDHDHDWTPEAPEAGHSDTSDQRTTPEGVKEAVMSTVCEECGAQVAKERLVCPRGHRLTEAWSPAARLASAAKRKSVISYQPPGDEGGNPLQVPLKSLRMPLSVASDGSGHHVQDATGMRVSSHSTSDAAHAAMNKITSGAGSAMVGGGMSRTKGYVTPRDYAAPIKHGPVKVKRGGM